VISLLISHLVLILMFRLAFTLVIRLTLLHMLFLSSLMGDRFLHRPGFPIGGSYTHLELRHLNDPRFPRHGSRPTRPSCEVQRIVKTFFDRMVKCWILKIYLTNPNTEPSTFSHPV
jgi:hypothetical protein